MGDGKMSNSRRSSFSLLTLFLVIAIAALGVSHYVMMREVREARREVEAARQELEVVRKQFGYLRIDDPKKIYITKIEGTKAVGGNHYRLYIPPGHRYLLHVGETEYARTGPVGTPKPLATLSMNSWREGADVVLHWTNTTEGEKRRLKVWTDTEELFDVEFPNYDKSPKFPSSVSYLPQDAHLGIPPEETIQFFSHGNEETKSGIVMWMEPLPPSMRTQARPAKK